MRDVVGWAVDLQDNNRPVTLDLLINDTLYTTTQTDRYRLDIANIYKHEGFSGFHFEIPPQLRSANTLSVAVVIRKTGEFLNNGRKVIRPGFKKKMVSARAPSRPQIETIDPPVGIVRLAGDASAPKAALIILNLNGAQLLDRHFSTFRDHNTYPNVEHVVIDHGSTDNTDAIIQKWQSTGLKITYLPRGQNFSFSASNNYAKNHTDAEYLIFCNNDIFFIEDTLPPFIDVLKLPAVGIAGLKLVDERREENEYGPHLIQHLGVHYDGNKLDRTVHPHESRYVPLLDSLTNRNFLVPTVTGAFIGMKRADFEAVGEFCEDYVYGYEDVDLCLSVKLLQGKDVALVGRTKAIHYRGYSRKKGGAWSGVSVVRNRQLLSERFGLVMRRILRENIFIDHQYWTATKPVFAFAVSEAKEDTAAGDFYTAYELASAMSKIIDGTFVFLEEQDNWYDLRDIDVLVVMTHNYDTSRLKQRRTNLITVGWGRNWFEEWSKARGTPFDYIFTSSQRAATEVKKALGYPENVLRIATNIDRFQPPATVTRNVDYVFTGNFWGHTRDLIYWLEPEALPYSFEIYGAGWERLPSFERYVKGFVKYDELAAIYHRAKVVIDDANSVTKEWGSVNSRVFDAPRRRRHGHHQQPAGIDGCVRRGAPIVLQSGRTGGAASPLLRRRDGASRESERAAGHRSAAPYLCGTRARAGEHAEKDRNAYVPDRHQGPLPVRGPGAAMGRLSFRPVAGQGLRSQGHSVRIDLLNRWHTEQRLYDDVSICLRGLSRYEPVRDHINICWLISHPEEVSVAELRKYDRVYVASETYAQHLREQGLDNVETLLQCVDTQLFQPDPTVKKEFDVLFVGNSRNVYRPIIRDAIEIGAPLTVIGSGWDMLIPKNYILSRSVPNAELAGLYSKARVVLNDHWSSMMENGFISNRLFDCAAVGAYVISDPVKGLADTFGSYVQTYRSQQELRELIEQGLRAGGDSRLVAQGQDIARANSFEQRAGVISEFITGSFEELWRTRAGEPKREVSLDGSVPRATGTDSVRA